MTATAEVERSEGALGVVVIGRNEGERLMRCIESAQATPHVLVYVDSGSTDGSAERVRGLGHTVVELDMSLPFCAARARNEGFRALLRLSPGLRFVQFVDGDCELRSDWLAVARARLEEVPDLAIVCGRRREREPERSLYNRLCDIEWDTPVGWTSACGGDFLVRAAAFEQVGGFDDTVVAGEEPELCHRLIEKGYRIERLDREMTLHDAAMYRFSQWWRRAARAGYAFALVAWLHRRSDRRPWARQVISILAWSGFGVVISALALAWDVRFALGLIAYPLLALKIYRSLRRHRGLPASDARAYAVACVIGKFAELQGVLRAVRDLLFRRSRTIMEYKLPAQ